VIWSVIGFLLTVMVLSYLIKDSLFFRLAAYLLIGLTAGYLVVLLVNRVLLPQLIWPMGEASWTQRLWLLIPLVLAFLLLIGQIPKLSQLSRIPLAVLLGVSAAIAIGGAVFGTLLPQGQAILDAFDPYRIYAEPQLVWMRILDAGVMILGVVGTLSYFHFGQPLKKNGRKDEDKRPKILQSLSKVGEVFLGITLGTVFAGVFSTALLALIDRIAELGDVIGQLLGGL
jgi:CBS domain containing-hemolysin-like protein